jgi:hypothetical protein
MARWSMLRALAGGVLLVGCATDSSENPLGGDAGGAETGSALADTGSGHDDSSSGHSASDGPTTGEDSGGPEAGNDSGITDPGTEGDGDRTIGPGFTPAPETMTQPGVPKGAVISFTLPTGTIFPMAPARQVQIYVPGRNAVLWLDTAALHRPRQSHLCQKGAADRPRIAEQWRR